MNDDMKLSYTIKWSQPYPYSLNFILVDLTEALEQSIEDHLSTNNFKEATEVINSIRNKT